MRLVNAPLGNEDRPKVWDRHGTRLVLWIYGPIGGASCNADAGVIVDALSDNADAVSVIVRIASAGGYEHAAVEIYNALVAHPGRVIAIDEVPERLAMAEAGGAETIDFSKLDVYDELMSRTNKRGPDSCIDAVGCEASGHGAADAVLDKVKAAAFLATDRVHVLRQVIMCCRKAGTISIPGVYVGMGNKLPIGAAMNKGLTIKTGKTHVQAYTKPLLQKIEEGSIDPSFVITHPANLEAAPEMYKKFRDKEDGVIKVVLRPGS